MLTHSWRRRFARAPVIMFGCLRRRSRLPPDLLDRLSRAIAELGDEPQDIGLKMGIADTVIAADQRHDLAPVEGLVARRDVLGEVLRHHPIGIALEEEGGRDVEDLRDVVEPAGRDANIARLVFLHGLERHADLARESALAEPQLDAPQSHPAADIDVDRMRLVILAWNNHSRSPVLPAFHPWLLRR